MIPAAVRDVDEADQRPDRKIDRRPAGERGRHQRIGRQNQRRHDDLGAADAGTRHQVRASEHGDDQQSEKQQNRNEQKCVERAPSRLCARFTHGV
jgi:hypothetical protein